MSMNWLFRRQREAPPLMAAGLLGKIPSQPDFIREACSGELPDALDRWLVEAAPLLHELDAIEKLPVARFCHASARSNRALIGVLGPSRDSAGRDFPVALFRELSLPPRARIAELLDAYDGFLEEAQALYSELPSLSSAEVRERLRELPDPERERAPLPLMAAAALARLFESELPGMPYYALGTFASAFLEADAERELALACPIR
ncbi:MAG TPA: type VI secretion system-associated protein TagF, partial [Polyangiales bacterium]|nr:type VI secretion system-associated protein TagF [Polyangiales bacterium]